MPVKKCDVAVIGAGMAGAVTAMTAAEAGKSVTVVHRAGGATSLSGGTVDICANPFVSPRMKWDKLLDVKNNIQECILAYPFHPYTLLSNNSASSQADTVFEKIAEAVEFIEARLRNAGLALNGEIGRQTPVPTSLGTWKLTSMFQSSVMAGPPHSNTAVLGVKGLDFPDAAFLAGMLESTLKAKASYPVETIDFVEVEMEGDRRWSLPELYERVSRPSKWNEFLEKAEKAAGGKYELLLVPPFIPYHSASAENAALADGARLREIASAPVNAAGLRLSEALDKALTDSEVEKIKAKAVSFDTSNGTINKCFISDESETFGLEADKWVLATGKFAGGGLVKEDGFREKLLDLPLFCEGEEIGNIWIKKTLGESVTDRHKAFSVGVATDSHLKPLNSDRKVIYDNLHAAGAVLGGYNYHADGCGLGMSILTGRLAGKGAGA